ncbi:MAG TPA: oxygenase MpaB family protein [Candidatus Limnocylindrales bacterium]|nr:oxygenase MpaB family protein [Candidatus Limnocylindrales bacterium]
MGRGPPARRTLTSVAGSGARPAEVESDIVDAGLYGPGTEAWRLNREAMLLLGAGPRALLLQLAHPLVAEGVDQHSNFRDDPWARLAATLRSYLRIVYGTIASARGEIQRLNELHNAVRGPVTDPSARARHGARYSARDPELSLWVHATLVDSTMVAYDAWLEPLPRERRAAFYAETLAVGQAFGIPEAILPPDLAAFDAYLEAMLAPDGPVEVGDLARELGGAVLAPPLGPALAALGDAEIAGHDLRPAVGAILDALPAAAYRWLLWPSIGLLPASVRQGYHLRWGPVERAVSAWLVTSWKAWRPLLPAGFRQMPQALAADRRVGPPVGGAPLLGELARALPHGS